MIPERPLLSLYLFKAQLLVPKPLYMLISLLYCKVCVHLLDLDAEAIDDGGHESKVLLLEYSSLNLVNFHPIALKEIEINIVDGVLMVLLQNEFVLLTDRKDRM